MRAPTAPAGALRLGQRIAQPPEGVGLRFARGDRRVGDQLRPPAPRRARVRAARRAARRRRVADTASISTCQGWRPASGARVPGICSTTRSSSRPGNRSRNSRPRRSPLRTGAAAPAPRAGSASPTHATRALGDRRRQPQRRGGHHAQRALRPDQQLVQVVAAIVLLERRQAVVDRSVGQHRLDPRDQRRASSPSAAPACRRRWSRPGRRSSPIRARPASAGSAAPPRPPRRGGRPGSPRPPPPPDSSAPISRADAVHPPERQDQRRSVGRRRRAADHRRVARPAAPARTPCSRARSTIAATSAVESRRQQRRRRAVIAPAPVGQPRRDVVRVGRRHARAEAGHAASSISRACAGVVMAARG